LIEQNDKSKLIIVNKQGTRDLYNFPGIIEIAVDRSVIQRMVSRVHCTGKEKERLVSFHKKRITVALLIIGIVVGIAEGSKF
jgi:hypothetical protein